MARDFNGTTDRIDYAASPYNPKGQNFTFSCWVNADTLAQGHVVYLLTLNNAADTAFTAGFLLTNAGAGQYNQLYFFHDGTTDVERVGADLSFTPASAWHHCLMTWDGSTTAANIHIYFNGTEISYATTTNGASLIDATGRWSLGGRSQDDTRNFDGKMADCAAWNRILSAGEIATLAAKYAASNIPRGLVFYAPLVREERDVVSGKTATLDGTAVTDHPRLIRPSYLTGMQSYEPSAAPAGHPTMRRWGGVPGMKPGGQLFGSGWAA